MTNDRDAAGATAANKSARAAAVWLNRVNN
jgi:hypothetical protein